MAWQAAAPELFLAIVAMAALVIGAFRDKDGYKIACLGAIGALVVAVLLVWSVERSSEPLLDGHFVLDDFAAFAKSLIYLGAAAALAMAMGERIGGGRFEYPVLALFSALGMGMMVSASSLLALYVALELMSLPLYVLAAFDRRNPASAEAGLKYFVLGALASGLILYGCSLIYGFSGSLRFEALARGFAEGGKALPLGALVGLVFLLSGLAFKLAAAPFHMWAPDVYQGAPTGSAAFIAAAPKVAVMALVLRLLVDPFGEWVASWSQVVAAIALASMVAGAFGALMQTDLKRLLAYSGIGHAGYALTGAVGGGEAGVEAVMLYMSLYLVMTLAAFACVMTLRRDEEPVSAVADLGGIARTRPWLAAAVVVLMLSLAGLPPLAGFLGKFAVFTAAVDAGWTWLAVAGLLSSVVAAFYYLRVCKVVCFDPPAEALDPGARPALRAVIALGAGVAAFFLLLPGPLMAGARMAAASLAP